MINSHSIEIIVTLQVDAGILYLRVVQDFSVQKMNIASG